MADERTGRIHRVTFSRKDGTLGQYYTIAENACSAISSFQWRTENPTESVVSVDVEIGYRWIQVM